MRKILFLLTFVFCFLLATVCDAMQIKMLNVGQGEAILIQTDNQNILIDTADPSERKTLRAELETAGVNRIDTLILSHAHADHIGNAAYIIDNFSVSRVYDNGFPTTSRYFSNYHKYLARKNIAYTKLQRGDIVNLDDGVNFEVVYPADDLDGLSVNNQSIVGKLTYGNFSMLFTGDLESEGETEILDENAAINATVLKAAHHGSRTSSLYNFVEAVNPIYVVISAGRDNKYGHPHADSVATYLVAGVPSENILCTAFNGTITIDTDGNSFTVDATKNDWAYNFVKHKPVKITKARRID